jgi:hypothetical protein
MILDETLQRVDAVCQVLKLPAILSLIEQVTFLVMSINRTIYLTCQVIECIEITLTGVNRLTLITILEILSID